jgi:anti-sigma-K factor RskA
MHTNPELLALLALGEDVGNAEERAHLRSCPECSTEVAELAKLAGIGRSAGADDLLIPPAPQVWDRVRAELGFADSPSLERTESTDLPAPTVSPLPVPGRSARRSLRWMALAAVLALIAGFGIGTGWQQFRQPSQTVIAKADLKAFPKYPGSSGSASITIDEDGNKFLVVKISTPDQVQDLQVWMIDSTGKGMRAMGFIDSGGEPLPLPRDMSLVQFPTVDVSDEPLNDANPAHSGNTVVRGTLDI